MSLCSISSVQIVFYEVLTEYSKQYMEVFCCCCLQLRGAGSREEREKRKRFSSISVRNMIKKIKNSKSKGAYTALSSFLPSQRKTFFLFLFQLWPSSPGDCVCVMEVLTHLAIPITSTSPCYFS